MIIWRPPKRGRRAESIHLPRRRASRRANLCLPGVFFSDLPQAGCRCLPEPATDPGRSVDDQFDFAGGCEERKPPAGGGSARPTDASQPTPAIGDRKRPSQFIAPRARLRCRRLGRLRTRPATITLNRGLTAIVPCDGPRSPRQAMSRAAWQPCACPLRDEAHDRPGPRRGEISPRENHPPPAWPAQEDRRRVSRRRSGRVVNSCPARRFWVQPVDQKPNPHGDAAERPVDHHPGRIASSSPVRRPSRPRSTRRAKMRSPRRLGPFFGFPEQPGAKAPVPVPPPG